jgi:hypothetical protein
MRYARALAWAVAAIAMAAAVVVGVWAARRDTSTPAGRRLARLVAESPFRNVGPRVGYVGYVGDAACARCHTDVADSYRTHPMGRSVAPAAAALDAGPLTVPGDATFDATGYHYTVERRGDQLIHREQKLKGDGGEPVASVEAVVACVLGSGERGYSFLVERDGFVAQSPVAWYAQERRYDVAPGYHERNFHFERVINPACLSCHADRATPAGGAHNRYSTPLDLRPIGCERCHGPGSLHVDQPSVSSGGRGLDPTIVNPRHLAPALRDAVCEQCHLQGADRFLRSGRKEGEFRPGLPLDEFVAVFVEAGPTGRTRAVGQVEQMHASRCYAATAGALGCTSCHDPHHRPGLTERVEHYRASCLACHKSSACRIPQPDRRARQADDSCIACHMPRRGTKDVAHTAMTDHRIPRSATAAADGDFLPGRSAGTDPVTRFWPVRTGGPSGAEADRDLGIALFHAARERWRQGGATDLAARASVLLSAALAERPDDVPALEAKAHLLWMRGHTAEARDAFRAGLEIESDNEWLLEGAAALAGATGQRDEAVALLGRAVAVNPYCADYPRRLADLQAESGQWPESARAARSALGLDISLVDAWISLVVSQARLGDLDAARDSLRRLRAFDPAAADTLHRALFAGKDRAGDVSPVWQTDHALGDASQPGKPAQRPSAILDAGFSERAVRW